MQKLKERILLFGTAFVVVFTLLAFVIMPDQKISISERRALAQKPKLTLSELKSGNYMKQSEKYLLDQIVFREQYRKLYTTAQQKLFRRTEINGYIQKENAIYRLEEKLSVTNITKNASYFEQIRKEYFPSNKVYYSIIPDKNYYLDKPCGYERFPYEKENELVEQKLTGTEINISDCLSLEDYYRTDLHWKQEKLSKVKSRLLEVMFADREYQEDEKCQEQDEKYQKKDIRFQESEEEEILLTKSFAGSYLYSSGYSVEPDKLYYLQSEKLGKVTVFDYEKNVSMPMYTLEKLGTGDDYDIFLGGAKALLTIDNPESETDQELIIFRDSYTSSLVPLLAKYYRKITLVDLRYTKASYVLPSLSYDENTTVLFLYQAMTLNANNIRIS